MIACKDCKHYRGAPALAQIALHQECTAPQAFTEQPDYVNGTIMLIAEWRTAANMRKDTDACGPDAKWFEERKDAA